MNDDIIDLSACVPQAKIIKMDGKEYKLSFPFRAIEALERQYGTIKEALEDLYSPDNGIYKPTLNFLYAALGNKYNLKKTDIEEWITVTTINILYNAVYEALLGSFGKSSGNDNNDNEGEM